MRIGFIKICGYFWNYQSRIQGHTGGIFHAQTAFNIFQLGFQPKGGPEGQELFLQDHGALSCRAGIDLITHSFCKTDKFIISFGQVKPELTEEVEDGMRNYVDHYIEECTTNGLSMVVCDTANQDEMVAASIQKDYSYFKPRSEKQENNCFLAAMSQYEGGLIENTDHEMKSMLNQKGKVVDLIAIAVKPSAQGKKIGKTLFQLEFEQGKTKGFTYTYALSGHKHTEESFIKAGGAVVAGDNFRDFQFRGYKPFSLVDESTDFCIVSLHHL